MSAEPCDRCCRKLWDPAPGGFMLICYGHLDGEVFVPEDRQKKYRVKACEMFLERPIAQAERRPQRQIENFIEAPKPKGRARP